MKRAIERCGDEAQARVREDRRADGEPAPRRQAAASRPTCTSTSELFPNDTVQSRLPDPAWLERWLDEQIRFDASWEKRVVGMILHNLSSLFGQTFETVQRAEPLPQVARAGRLSLTPTRTPRSRAVPSRPMWTAIIAVR